MIPVRRLVVPSVLLAVLALGGCADENEGGNAGDAEAQRLAAELRDLPGVAEAEVTYARDASTPGDVTVQLELAPAGDPQAVVDAATRAVWLSRLDPLASLVVDAIDPADPDRALLTDVVVAEKRAALERRFGPRPQGVGA